MNTIDSLTATRIASTLAVAAVSLASAACSAGGSSIQAPQVPPAYTGAAACHATGEPTVLARKVFVPAGVEATAQDGGFTVRFATAASRCLAVAWGAIGEHPQAASCPTPGARTAAREDASDETMLAWESHDEAEPRIKLGVVTYDTPLSLLGARVGARSTTKVVERTFLAPGSSRDGGQMAPALAPIGHDRFLLAWVDGNVASHELRAQSVAGWGDALGPSMVLSPKDASVIGRPSVVVAPTGYGLVSYVASIDGEFDVLSTPVACATN
jgi:hypothetical protein